MQTTLDISVPSDSSSDFSDKFSKMTASIQTVKSQMDIIKQTIKELEKMVKAEQKKTAKAQKVTKDKAEKKEARKPSGFAAPSLLSDDLCNFLSLDTGTQMPRTTVTSKLHDYIKANKLQCEKDAKVIKPNDALKTLLKLEESDELTYFNLQRFMNIHFNKIEIVLDIP